MNEHMTPFSSSARFIAIFMCVLSLGWDLAIDQFVSVDQMIYIFCAIFNLIFLFTANPNSYIVSAEARAESLSDAIMRKQLQALNWRSMFNKALFMRQLRRELISVRPASPISFVEPKHKPKHNEMRSWKSWNGQTEIPTFICQIAGI
jgi:hypothetical protein